MPSIDKVPAGDVLPEDANRDLQSDSVDENTSERYVVRPGACILPISADELQITFPNYTATFNGVPVVTVIGALLAALADGRTRSAAVSSAVSLGGYSENFVEHVFEMVIKAECLTVEPERGGEEYKEHVELANFYSSLGENPKLRIDELREGRTLIIQSSGTGPGLAPLLHEAGLTSRVREAATGDSVAEILDDVTRNLNDTTVRIIACWGIPYRLALPRKLNELAVSRHVPILFGTCEGIVARIGPYVMPGATACLECAIGRLLSHAGHQEIRAYAELRARSEECVPKPWPSHPTFREAMARLFVLELSRIMARDRVATMGAFVEHTVLGGTADRHPVLRVPRCPGCSPVKPHRLAWDIRFPVPETAEEA